MKIFIRPCSFIFILIIVCLLLPLFSNSSPDVHHGEAISITTQAEIADSLASPIKLTIDE